MYFDEEHSLNNPEVNQRFYELILEHFMAEPCDHDTARNIEKMLDAVLEEAAAQGHPYHLDSKEVKSFLVDFNVDGEIGLTPYFEVLDIKLDLKNLEQE
jgi:hypothetical protein